MTRVIFMGTPTFPFLSGRAGGWRLRHRGRGDVTGPSPRSGPKLDLTPVKQAAVARGIPVMQPLPCAIRTQWLLWLPCSRT